MPPHGEGRGLMPQSNLVVATVDDDRRVRDSVQSVLESAGYEAVTFESAETFLLSGALSRVTCVIADVRLPGMDGTELQRRIRRERRQLPVILITAHDDDDVRQQALRDGAVAFLVKPFDGGDLLEHVARATNYVLTIRAGGTDMAGPLIGNSAAFGEVTEAIAMVAPVDSAVLLVGETGTGKEVIARAIHDAGPRRHQRFVAVNCAAIPVRPARKRTIRSRARRIHGRCLADHRAISGRGPRHAVPRRSRRPPAGTATQTAPGAPGASG